MHDLGLRRLVDSPHLRGFQRSTEEYVEFEKVPFGTHEEVAGRARKHDRFVRGVNPLIAKGNGGLAQPLPGIPQIIREVLSQSRFGGRPTVVLFSVLNPLLAVIALSTGHARQLYWRWSRNRHRTLDSQQQMNRSDSPSGMSRVDHTSILGDPFSW